jgi:hypothetical protein
LVDSVDAADDHAHHKPKKKADDHAGQYTHTRDPPGFALV